jgi:predicted nucleotidyltransferase
VFGSALPKTSPAESDLDLLVEFKPMEPYARVKAYFRMLSKGKWDAQVSPGGSN